jgi:hypothetical protein
MIGRRRAGAERALADGERLVQDGTAWSHAVAEGAEEIALQVSRHEDEREALSGQRVFCQVGAPSPKRDSVTGGMRDRIANRVERGVDAEGPEAGCGERCRVASASHRDIERPFRRRRGAGQRCRPLDHEWRWGHTVRVSAALLTALALGVGGLVATALVGLGVVSGDIARHISFGFFSTLVILLAHSMMMFYLIGKGKAVKDAMKEGGRAEPDPYYTQYVRRISAARRPVFSIGSLAMAVTMVAAILGASVDTGVLPPMIHATIAYGSILCNVAAVKI